MQECIQSICLILKEQYVVQAFLSNCKFGIISAKKDPALLRDSTSKMNKAPVYFIKLICFIATELREINLNMYSPAAKSDKSIVVFSPVMVSVLIC